MRNIVVLLLCIVIAGAAAYRFVPSVRHALILHGLFGDGLPIYTVGREPEPTFIADPYYDYKSLPGFVVDNIEALTHWGQKTVAPAARAKARNAIAKSLALPASFKSWDLYVESRTGNAILAGGVMIGTLVHGHALPVLLVVEGGNIQPLATLEPSGRAKPDQWTSQRAWLWHKPKGQAVIALASPTRHPPAPTHQGPPQVTWTVLVNGVARTSQLTYSDVASGDDLHEKALITGTISGGEFGKSKALFFLTPSPPSMIGDYPLSPLVLHRG